MPTLVRKSSDTTALRSRLAVFALGGASALGFEPFGWWWLTVAAMAGLLALLARAPNRRSAGWLGWGFGLGQFALGLNWIATSFTYQAQMPAWLGWVGVLLLSLYLALYPALASVTAWWLARANRGALVPALAGTWIVSEWLRGWVLTGFPWNPLGVIALGGFDRPGLARILPWLGTYALSGVVVLLAGLTWIAIEHRKWWLAPLPLLPFLAPLHGDPAQGHLAFTLVQPNTPQEELNDPATFESQFAKTASLSAPSNPGAQRLVLWPESGVPDYLRSGYPGWLYAETTFASDPAMARARIGRVIGPGSLLLTGAVDLDISDGRPVDGRNVVTGLDASGDIVASYAKAHLVPFGEYLPLRWLLTPLGLSRLVPGDIDFKPGPGPRTLDLGAWGKAGVQICYEIIFPGHVIDRDHRPDYLFNPSNDGWFGAWGPPQHLAQARMRAIEEGMPVLRATTTGISAVIDADGGVRVFAPLHQSTRLEGLVPPAHAPTPFARLGNWLSLGWALILLTLSKVASRRVRR